MTEIRRISCADHRGKVDLTPSACYVYLIQFSFIINPFSNGKTDSRIHVYLQLFGRSNDNKGCDQLKCKCDSLYCPFSPFNKSPLTEYEPSAV